MKPGDGTTLETARKRKRMKSRIHLEEWYPHPRSKAWRAITEPALLEKWLMRPEGFALAVGTRFKLFEVGEHRGWRGFAECEVLAVDPRRLFRISWVGDEKHKPQTVTFALFDEGAGTRLKVDHEGFEGLGGFVLSRFILRSGWKKMLQERLPRALGGAA
jgi:uncharacterized protein YndB with AHSA1/START domain